MPSRSSSHDYPLPLIRYYTTTGYVSEVIAQDLGTLCAEAYRFDFARHSDLLEIFLTVDDIATAKNEENTLLGIRRAQVKLACFYLERGEERVIVAVD